MTPTTALFLRFGVALGIGILIGLQREFASDDQLFAGIRTFSLLGLAGCAAAFLSDLAGSPWIIFGVIIMLGSLISVAYFIVAWKEDEIGLTTEVAAFVTVLAGALAYWDQLALAAALGVAITVLLALKLELRRFVQQLTREDVYATLRFAVITAIVLPVLPNQSFGPPPFDVLNPYKIWLMVVFISGINFLGYVLIKVVGARRGIGLTGFLGGLASSTAVTLSFAQRSQRRTDLARSFGLAVTIAWTIMFPRILVEVGVVNPDLLRVLWPPVVAAGVVALLYALYLYFGDQGDDNEDVEFSNPFDLGPAIKFGLLYAGILLISRAAELSPLGDTGIYFSSLIAGFVDVDAITLSIAQLSQGPGGIDLKTAERAIILAAMSNTAVKGGIVILSGSRDLRRAMLPAFLLIIIAGGGVAFLL